jgi:hypothetical protein
MESWEEGLEKAERFLQVQEPERLRAAELVTLKETGDYTTSFNYQWERRVNGIPYPMDRLAVTVDRQTGEVSAYERIWGAVKCPSPDKRMTEKDLMIRLLRAYPLELVYARDFATSANPPVDLVWRMHDTPTIIFDARDGRALDECGRAIEPLYSPENELPKPWQQNACEADAKLAAEIGLWKPGTELETPEAELTWGSLGDLMARMCGYEPAARGAGVAEVNAAFSILRQPADAPVNRLQLARILCRYLGYERLARVGAMAQPPYSDTRGLPPADRGAVAVCHSLGIMRSMGKRFYPARPVTAAETISALIRALRNR